MEELENELEEPTGISTVKAPELALEGVLLSQDCGILYEVKHAVGVQYVLSPYSTFMAELICRVSGRRGYTARSPHVCAHLRLFRSELIFYADSGISTLVNFILMALFRRQAAVSSTAAGLSRVSRYTFLIQSLIDAISFVGVSTSTKVLCL